MTKTMDTDGNIFDIGHCSGIEFPLPNENLSWGFAKYKITISVAETNEKYQFYINSLDSKYGRTYTGGYSRDLYVRYLSESPLNRRILFSKKHNDSVEIAIDTIATWDSLANGKPSKEYKLWKVILGQDNPMEKNFYARTTPFPISPRAMIDNSIRELELGTKVIFDTVYNYTGLSDKYGYNTIDSASVFFPYFSNPPIPSGENSEKNTYVTPAYFSYDPNYIDIVGLKINVLPGDTIILKPDKRFWISGYNQYSDNGDTLVLSASSVFIKETAAQLNTCYGGTILDYGAIMNWSPNSFSHIFQNSELSYLGTSHTINNSGHVEIDGYARLKVGNNTTVTFDGAGTYLKLNPNSIVQLGENAKIEFKNGAYLIANGSAISSAQGSHGRGIVLENAGEQTSITNCTFNNLMSSIFVKNTDAGYYEAFKNISNNTFYTDAICHYVIETKNTNNITISNNHIYMMQGEGLGILMRYYTNEGNEESASPTYAVNVMGNEISNGVVSAALISFTNSYPHINFKYNNCYGNVSNTNVVYRLSHGNIKNNTFSNNSGKNLDLLQANPDVLSNSFYSYIMNLTNNDSYPYFAPISTTTDGGWVWRGGKNTLTSSSNGNIYYNNGNVVLDWGQNYFSKGYYNYHLQGRINEPSGVYYVRNNCFNGSHNPSSSLRDYYSDTTVVTPYYAGSYINCSISTDAGTIWQIDDLGNGFYDTLYRTDNNSGYQPEEDEGLYSSAIEKKLNDDNYGAVSTFKTLINLHPQSVYTEECLYSLYECYQKLDTSRNQTSHDILYSDLKYFLDSKIASGLYSDEFNLNAYNITVMCLASISKYYEAMSGYEFIALYHPDEYLSFLASYDYAEIEDLMNGSGGISSKEENMTQEEYYKKLKKRIDRKIDDDPVKKMVKKSFDRTKAEKFSKIEKDAASRTNSNETAKQEIARIKSKYDEAKMKAVSIMRTSKSLTREEKDRKQIEDILLTKTEENKESATFSNIVPDEYSISQNYPNPFNPNTKINFALPKQGFVSLKIYDITGREIKTLVNEVKQAGYYTVDFNGSNLSSGVYFYKIQSGDFSSVKRMVLVK
ncbi:MAG: T9SS type A sorting domain-containing protein [Ignavibacteria bacterium]